MPDFVSDFGNALQSDGTSCTLHNLSSLIPYQGISNDSQFIEFFLHSSIGDTMSDKKTDKPVKIERPEDKTFFDGDFYCRKYDSLENEIDCTGSVSSDDECARWASDAWGYSWTRRPCGS